MNIDVPYGITRRLPTCNLGEARARITASLQAEGSGVLTAIDVQKTLEAKLGLQAAPPLVLGACNPFPAWLGSRRRPRAGAGGPWRTPETGHRAKCEAPANPFGGALPLPFAPSPAKRPSDVEEATRTA